MGVFEWLRKREAIKEYQESAACEALHLELCEAKMRLRYRRLQLRILRLKEKDLKRKLKRNPSYVR